MAANRKRAGRRRGWAIGSLCALVSLLGLLAGCAPGSGGSRQDAARGAAAKLQVVTTTGMVRDLVAAILGDAAEVESMMGPGVDPHLYQPTRHDAIRLSRADLVVYNGLHLEGRLTEILERRHRAGGATLAVADFLDPTELLEADGGRWDPHIWMDVRLWGSAVEPLAEALAAQIPEEAERMESRAREYAERLRELDHWAESTLATIPRERRVMITAHDAFRYFGRRYEVEVYGVQGVSTISEAAVSDVNRLVDLITARRVPAVFFESSVSPRHVQAILEGARRRGMPVQQAQTLLSDSLGPADHPTGTYEGMIRHNVTTITWALGDRNSVAERR